MKDPQQRLKVLSSDLFQVSTENRLVQSIIVHEIYVRWTASIHKVICPVLEPLAL